MDGQTADKDRLNLSRWVEGEGEDSGCKADVKRKLKCEKKRPEKPKGMQLACRAHTCTEVHAYSTC